jgi:hypothetical protein
VTEPPKKRPHLITIIAISLVSPFVMIWFFVGVLNDTLLLLTCLGVGLIPIWFEPIRLWQKAIIALAYVAGVGPALIGFGMAAACAQGRGCL